MDPLFKDLRTKMEWESGQLAPLLTGIFQGEVDHFAPLGWLLLVTCIKRTPWENDQLYGGYGTHLDGVHVEWRGIDVRWNDLAGALATRVNDAWIYDPERPEMRVVLLEGEGVGSSAPHVHFQVHPRTVAA